MEGIIDTANQFNFDELYLTSPSSTNGGNYFIKILKDGRPLYVQPPKCKLKSGIVRSGKRTYCDLMFTNTDESFIEWIEKLEILCQERIFKNRGKWFDNELEKDDIENSFTSPFKIFKSGKYYILRATIPNMMGKLNLKIYDEHGKDVDANDINNEQTIATILDIQGIKCSARSFQLELQIKQMLIIEEVDIFNKCLLTANKHTEFNNTDTLSEDVKEEDVKEEDVEEEDVEDVEEDVTDNNDEDVVPEEVTAEHVTTEYVITEDEPASKINTPDNFSNSDKLSNENAETETANATEVHTTNDNGNLVEIDIKPSDDETMFLKKRDDVYYNMYREALKKAKLAKTLALTNYLEAKRIKNTYMLTDLNDDSDMDDSIFSDDDE
jgi:hypothetical protein